MIEVRINSSNSESRTAELAIAKGREIGCWILIERSAFERLRERARLEHGATVILAHGPGPHIAGAPRPTLTTIFHCIGPTTARAHDREPPEQRVARGAARGGVACRAGD